MMEKSKNLIYTDDSITNRINDLLKDEYVSHSALQKCFNISYPKAGRIIDEMLKRGFIISQNPQVLISAKFNMSVEQELRKYLFNEMKKLNKI